ncbi:MAG: hypothetical protein ACI8P9_001911 [Parasphingorhabdus sp.]|jgi:hypothetical protein
MNFLNTLNLTNGDNSIDVLKNIGVKDPIVPWRDVLHEGPILEKCSHEEQSRSRAEYIISQGWGDSQKIKASFANRDKQLGECGQFDSVYLWFEHDLYDQLQIAQILHWFAGQPKTTNINLFCTENYLGLIDPPTLIRLLPQIISVDNDMLGCAVRIWETLCEPAPQNLAKLRSVGCNGLPFMGAAINRLCEEYPSKNSGLSRSCELALLQLIEGDLQPATLFGRYQKSEPRKFMGDSSFFRNLLRLQSANNPLIEYSLKNNTLPPFDPEQRIKLTTAGRKVLSGESHWLDNNSVDEWIGGVHLQPGNYWCWDSLRGEFIQR